MIKRIVKTGDLSRRIVIERKTVTLDPIYNTDVITWAAHATVWANIQDELPSRARSEGVVNGAIESSLNLTRVRFRWLTGITSADRIKILTPVVRYLQIVSGPAEIGGNRAFIEVMGEQVTV